MAAQNSNLVQNQHSSNPHAVYNGRPVALTGPPLSIYHPIFQAFMREYSAPVDLMGISEEDIIRASNLMVKSANYYKREEDRLRKISPDLAHFLNIDWKGAFVSEARRWVPTGHTKVACPLSRSGGLGVISPANLFFELKNGFGDGHADPVEQAQHDYVLLCTSSEAGAFDWLNDGPSDLVYRWNHSADEAACPYSLLGWRDLISGFPAQSILIA
jgi:hypothetical protein